MSNNAPDYNNDLVFAPKTNTDQSTEELIDKIEALNSWVDLKSEHIVKLEQLLWECRDAMNDGNYWQQCELIKQIDELLGERK